MLKLLITSIISTYHILLHLRKHIKMKKIFCLVQILIVIMTFSQSKKSDFIAAEIVKSDNTKINVLINKIYFPQNDSFLGMESEKNNKEIRKKFFEYKIDENDEPLKIYLSDIKKITLKDKYNDDILGYENMKVKIIDDKNKINNQNYSLLLPLVREGKVNFYSFDLNVCNGSVCAYMFSNIFLKKPNDEAVLQLELGNQLFFQTFLNALKEIGKDCEGFQNYLNEITPLITSKEFKKKFKNDLYDLKTKKYKEIRNQYSSGKVHEILTNLQKKYYYDYVIGFLKEYEKNCP